MNKSKIIIVLIALTIMTVPAVITVFRVQTVLATTYEPAIVTDCRSFRSGRSQSKYRSRTYHAPVAVAESGAIAIGTKRLSERSWCENMIGQQTSVYVHPTDPRKNRIGSYLQFWLMPSLFFFGLCLAFIPISASKKLLMGLGFVLLISVSLAREFGIFWINSDKGNVVLGAESRVDRCIEKWMGFQEVLSPRALTKLTCERVDDLSSLSKLPNLEELFIHRSPITSLQTIPDLPKLKILRLEDNTELTTLAGIERFENLEEIYAARNSLADIHALGPLKNLKRVSFYRETFKDISVLKDKMKLQRATFNVSRIKDLSPLFGKPELTLAGAIGETVLCDQVAKLKSSLGKGAKVWVPGQCQ